MSPDMIGRSLLDAREALSSDWTPKAASGRAPRRPWCVPTIRAKATSCFRWRGNRTGSTPVVERFAKVFILWERGIPPSREHGGVQISAHPPQSPFEGDYCREGGPVAAGCRSYKDNVLNSW